ncbi:MAG: glycosyltransferase family 2 protein, partial [Tepidisphaeraceae bacterium]
MTEPEPHNLLRISIVIPNYNSGPVLERAIRSLVDQNYPNLQIIMADSCSTDESPAIIEKYKHAFDVLMVEKDKGQADGLNKGFARADGDIHGWLCGDDELTPGTLHHIAELFEKDPHAGVVTGACERIFSDGTSDVVKPDPEMPWKMRVQNVIEQPSTFWRAALHRGIGPLDTKLHLCFDWEFWNRMRARGAKFVPTDRVLSRYFFSETNKTSSSGEKMIRELFEVLRRHGPMGGGLAYV